MESRKALSGKSKIGALLKSQREMLDLSQKQIAVRLGYEHFNYISMLETGSSKIPFSKIPQIVRAYRLDDIYMVIMMRKLYPESWNVIAEIVKAVPELDAIVHSTLEKDVDEIYEEALKEFRIW